MYVPDNSQGSEHRRGNQGFDPEPYDAHGHHDPQLELSDTPLHSRVGHANYHLGSQQKGNPGLYPSILASEAARSTDRTTRNSTVPRATKKMHGEADGFSPWYRFLYSGF